ncbi:hypothetical protein ALC57_14635, partial [Trachymyrmex cornetzi]
YQLSQAVSYLAEIMNDNANINNKNIVKLEVRSRHLSWKIYKCYIEYTLNAIGKVGIAIIYYLTHASYLSQIVRPAEMLGKLFNVEKVKPVINEDNDED